MGEANAFPGEPRALGGTGFFNTATRTPMTIPEFGYRFRMDILYKRGEEIDSDRPLCKRLA